MARRQREYNGNIFVDDGNGQLYNADLKKYLIYRPYPMLVEKVNASDKVEPDNKREYTSKQLKQKFGTDDTELINAGKEKEEQVAKVEDKKSEKRPVSDVDKATEKSNRQTEIINKGQNNFDPVEFEKWRQEVDPDFELSDDGARTLYELQKPVTEKDDLDDLAEQSYNNRMREAATNLGLDIDAELSTDQLSKVHDEYERLQHEDIREGIKRDGMLAPIDPYKAEDEADRIVNNSLSYITNGKLNTAIDAIKSDTMKYDDMTEASYIGDEKIGYYIQFQDRDKTTYDSTEDTTGKTESFTWARVFKDGKMVASFEDNKYKAREQVIDYLNNEKQDTAPREVKNYTEDKYGDRTYEEFAAKDAMTGLIENLNIDFAENDYDFGYRLEDGGIQLYDKNEYLSYTSKSLEDIEKHVKSVFGDNAYLEPIDGVTFAIAGVNYTNDSNDYAEEYRRKDLKQAGLTDSEIDAGYTDVNKAIFDNLYADKENAHPQNLIIEAKTFKEKDTDEAYTAKEAFLHRMKNSYNRDAAETKDFLKNVRILEESDDYVLYAEKDNEGKVWMSLISSYNPSSSFRYMPDIFYREDYKGSIVPGSAQVNWGAYGSVPPEKAKEFASKLQKSIDFAERLNKGKNYSDLWK